MIDLGEKYVFHVHTKRCGHASDEPDELYIKGAVEMGAESITFTDHAPFPNDPFNGRMKYSQLEEYIASLKQLKEKYNGIIDVHIGLEIEYIPSYWSYYEKLRANNDLEILMLGQHHYEISNGVYSFEKSTADNEYVGICKAIYEGINTGLFDVVAHPDRAFRMEREWSNEMTVFSNKLIDSAIKHNVKLEKNYSSMKKEGLYWKQFWDMLHDESDVIYGCDAHSVDSLILTV